MKISLCYVVLVNFLLINYCYAINPVNAGARSNATGNANTTQIDLYSAYNNQAGLAFLEEKEVGVFSERRYLTSELSTYGIAAALPVKPGTFGLSLSRFGYSAFNETTIGLSYGMKLSRKIAFGFQVKNFSTRIEGFNSNSLISVEMGLLTKVSEKVSIGAHLYNPTRPKLGEFQQARTQSIFSLGVNYGEKDKYQLFFDLDKNIETNVNARIGLEYMLTEIFAVRAGANTFPSQFFGGVGLKANQLDIDFASSYLSNLGFTPSLSLNYAF